jgi:hypothetical protein
MKKGAKTWEVEGMASAGAQSYKHFMMARN